MGKIVVSALTTLDGVQDDPLAWMGEMFDEASAKAALEELQTAEAMIMGRGTYEYFAPVWPNIPGPHAARVNAIRKIVFSSQLDAVDWANAELAENDLDGEIASLRQGAGGDLIVYGYGELARSLIRMGSVDRLEFSVFPILLGRGEPMLKDLDEVALALESVDQRPSGVVRLTYVPR